MTQNLINLIGLQRCGCHAVANWLLHQNPLVASPQSLSLLPNEISEQNDVCGFKIKNRDFLIYNQFWFKYQEPHAPTKLGYTPKGDVENAVIVYETGELRRYNIEFDNKKEVFGEIKNEVNVLVLRDYLNCAASWYKQHGECPPHIALFWYHRALEILGKTHYIPNMYFINYNKWFIDKLYRQQICKDLNLHFTDIAIDSVVHYGQGSSFDKQKFDGRAQDMSVNQRYKIYEQTPEFQQYKRPELIPISEKIFGEYE